MSGVTRGCGNRVKGGIYAEVSQSPFGAPIEEFLLDPPVIVNPDEIGISNIGVKQIGNVIWDIVGAKHYPNVADVIEEGRRFGFSRRIPKTMDFSMLTEKSRLLLLHSRAWIENHIEYNLQRCIDKCPKKQQSHHPGWDGTTSIMCAGLWWEDIEGGQPASVTTDGDVEALALMPDPDHPRLIKRNMPSFSYFGHSRPAGVTPQYVLAAFIKLPISRIVVINDDQGGTHKPSIERAQKAHLPVEVEEC
jgi:hypothetical protein